MPPANHGPARATPTEPPAKAKSKSKVCVSLWRYGFAFLCQCLQARKEVAILPANMAMNSQIWSLHEHWQCSLTMCWSDYCFIPAEGPHFALGHEHLEKWAAAIVCHLSLCNFLCSWRYKSFMGLHIQCLKSLQTSPFLIQFWNMLSFWNWQCFRLALMQLWGRKPPPSNLLFHLLTLFFWTITSQHLQPYPLSSLQGLLLQVALFWNCTMKVPELTWQHFAPSIAFPMTSTSICVKTKLLEPMPSHRSWLLTSKTWSRPSRTGQCRSLLVCKITLANTF